MFRNSQTVKGVRGSLPAADSRGVNHKYLIFSRAKGGSRNSP